MLLSTTTAAPRTEPKSPWPAWLQTGRLHHTCWHMARDRHGRQGRERLQEARGAASEQCFLDETNTAQTSSQFPWLPAQKPYKIDPVQRTAWTGRAGGAKQAPLLTEQLLAVTGGRGRESQFSSGM